LAVDRRVVTWRTAAVACLACGAGLAAYAFVWIRTVQTAPFLEVRAHSIGDLAAIVSGRQFQRMLFHFTPSELFEQRLPLIGRWLARELRWPGLVLAGVAALAPRLRRDVGLLVGCAACVTLFAVNYDVFDLQVFLLIPMIALGLTAALGMEAL